MNLIFPTLNLYDNKKVINKSYCKVTVIGTSCKPNLREFDCGTGADVYAGGWKQEEGDNILDVRIGNRVDYYYTNAVPSGLLVPVVIRKYESDTRLY